MRRHRYYLVLGNDLLMYWRTLPWDHALAASPPKGWKPSDPTVAPTDLGRMHLASSSAATTSAVPHLDPR